MKKKKRGLFGPIVLIYVLLLAVLILCVDGYVWFKLEDYERTELQKEKEQKEKIEKALIARLSQTPTPTPSPSPSPSPTPTPAPIIMEQVKIVKPCNAILYVDGEPMENPENGWTSEEDNKTFAALSNAKAAFSEYEGISLDGLPTLESTMLAIKKGTSISFGFGDSEELTPEESVIQIEIDGQTRTIRQLTCPYQNLNTDYDELVEMGFGFLEKYCLFVSNDAPATDMKPYFPSGSKYYQTIASLDNSWFNTHDEPPKFTNKTVKSFVAYTEDIVCMKLYMHQSFVTNYLSQKMESDIEHPLWFVRMNGSWKLVALEYTTKHD